jgi:hypothetical protein
LIHDPALLDQLSELPTEAFTGEVYRATRKNLDPLAFSSQAGRWGKDCGASVLYASMAKSGALAEICFHWSRLTPLPTKPCILHILRVTTKNTLRLLRTRLPMFGMEPSKFMQLDYVRTQEIGAAVAFLGYDGLIAPSARWECDNLMLFNGNQTIECRVEVISSETVDWFAWGREHGVMDREINI